MIMIVEVDAMESAVTSNKPHVELLQFIFLSLTSGCSRTTQQVSIYQYMSMFDYI